MGPNRKVAYLALILEVVGLHNEGNLNDVANEEACKKERQLKAVSKKNPPWIF